jgi:threonine/homoserine/homoserine lactone efflux protein
MSSAGNIHLPAERPFGKPYDSLFLQLNQKNMVFLNGIMLGLLVSVPLGPIGVLIIHKTLERGRLTGFVSGLGAAGADIAYALLACFGVGYIQAFIEERQLLLQVTATLLVLFLGLKIYFADTVRQYRERNRGQVRNRPLLGEFARVFLLTFSNPVSFFVFAGAFALTGMSAEGFLLSEKIWVIAGISLGTSGWWFTLSGLASLFRNRLRLRGLWWLNKIAGALIFSFGLIAGFGLYLNAINALP